MKKKAVTRKKRKNVKKLKVDKTPKQKEELKKKKKQEILFYFKLIYRFIKYYIVLFLLEKIIKISKIIKNIFLFLVNLSLFLLNLFFKIFTALIVLLMFGSVVSCNLTYTNSH